MSTRTYLISIGILLVVIASIFVFARSDSPAPLVVATPATVEATTTVPLASATSSATKSSQVATSTTATATLVVAGNSYSVPVTKGERVLEAMRAVSSTDTFAFTGRDYSGLGFFIDSINGVPNAGGKYWVFYVNGVSATVGVSSEIIIKGDIIEWKYEKSY